jgi:hypothetical protein
LEGNQAQNLLARWLARPPEAFGSAVPEAFGPAVPEVFLISNTPLVFNQQGKRL